MTQYLLVFSTILLGYLEVWEPLEVNFPYCFPSPNQLQNCFSWSRSCSARFARYYTATGMSWGGGARETGKEQERISALRGEGNAEQGEETKGYGASV